MNAQKTHVTDVDTWYHENRNIQLLLHLLVSSTGLGSSLRCLTAIDANFHESCTPNILVTILTTLSDLKFMIQGNVETTSGGSVVVQISIKDKPILLKMMSMKDIQCYFSLEFSDDLSASSVTFSSLSPIINETFEARIQLENSDKDSELLVKTIVTGKTVAVKNVCNFDRI